MNTPPDPAGSATWTRPTDVLVVGAGPAGLAAAIELGTRGVDCVIVDPRTEVSHKRPRGKTTHARTMEHFRRWGVADELRRLTPTPPDVFHDIAFCTSLLGTEVHRLPHALALFGDERPEMSETGLFIGQPHVEEVLRRKVETLATVRTGYGARATGRFTRHDDGVDVAVVGQSGAEHHVHARYVIVADGPRSTMREALAIPLDSMDEGRPSVSILFDSPGLFDRTPHLPAVFYWCIGGGGAGVLSPYDPARGLWVAGSQDLRAESDPTAVIRGLVGAPVDVHVVSVDVWQARRAVAERYREGPFFLVGDSARQTPPFGGHGYNTCVLDAIDLSWKLAGVIDGWGDEALLDTYELERKPVANYVIDTSLRNMRVLSQDLARAELDEPGPVGEAVRQDAAREIDLAKRAEFYSLGLVLGYTYAHSTAVLGGGAPEQPADGTVYVPSFAAGSRLPHLWLPDGRSLFDLLGPGFTLLTDDLLRGATLVAAAAARRVPLTIVDARRLPDSYKGPQAVLVRPDQHITWSGDFKDVNADALWDVAVGAARAPSATP